MTRPGLRAPGAGRAARWLGVLSLAAVTLALLDVFGGAGAVSGLRGAAAWALGPVQAGAARLADAAASAGRSLAGVDDVTRLEAENQRLGRELAASRARAADLAARHRLDGATPAGLRTVTARVVGFGAGHGWSSTVTIDAGARDGVRPDTTVLDADGLVGRVVAVDPRSSVVLLVTDPRFAVGVRTESGRLGVASNGATSLALFAAAGEDRAAPRAGSAVVTLGSAGGRPFVPGVKVGTVTADLTAPGALTGTATVRPAVDPAGLDFVAVVRPGAGS